MDQASAGVRVVHQWTRQSRRRLHRPAPTTTVDDTSLHRPPWRLPCFKFKMQMTFELVAIIQMQYCNDLQ